MFPTPQDILIIMDGHSSHTSNLDAIQYARNNGIIMLSLPPHATHKLQNLDVSFFKAFKTSYNHACHEWRVSHPRDRITMGHVGGLVAKAFEISGNIRNFTAGFQKCGVWPF
ncbi:hypothetical protein HPB48_020842 [Haemaphysalis longicornis]|uniref:DDE-1 domain-containing protein n=1 Tax=Haemaphysalis longicornis TaxID=44386 RepID=A0A9J6FDX8_HAELO|nr:hypothetical protein HPB48_020842 [Haemaphysalis longicornis]